MKKFITNILIIFSPFLLLIIFENITPINTFTFRPWEALKYQNNLVDYPFQPLSKVEMISYGELGYNSKFQVKKYEKWEIDSNGFRNNSIPKEIDILLVGDSFFAGSGNTQDSILSTLLKKSTHKEVYNLAPYTFESTLKLINSKFLSKPKILILSKVERNMIDFTNLEDVNSNIELNIFNHIKLSSLYRIHISKFIENSSRFYSLRFLKSKLTNSKGVGIIGKNNDSMLFSSYNHIPEDEIINITTRIEHYKSICDKLGIKFYFLPIPNKESVYYDFIPIKKPIFLNNLNHALMLKNINTLNTLDIFLESRKINSNKLLYHLDDTHWNSYGIKLMSDTLSTILNREN
jgi:alginate O-acetyltransferase complex protein AlgJ